jgi:flavin reductase (DIM6/NTAB) family NADH-FMN oxidoreductase RutF
MKELMMTDETRPAPDAAPLRQRFLEGMSQVAATVTVITTNGPQGRAGTTATAMSSVSADTPNPTLLVCINEMSSLTPILLGNGTFCVNVLKDDQALIADVFASRMRDTYPDKFDCTDWAPGRFGQPVIAGALVAFECKLVSHNQVGTHHVCFGEVVDAVLGDSGNSLIYASREYRTTVRPD